MDHDSTNFLKTVSLCCVDECMYVFAFKLIRFGQSFFGATFAVHFICQVGFVIGNPSGSRLEILGIKPLWKNGSSSVMSTLMNRPLLAILSSRAPITVTASLGQPGFLNNVILYFLFSDTWRQQMLFFSITCAEEAQHLQLEPLAPTREGRRI